ncbi:MAG TPA: GAF domain-containing protein [Methylomirabilota bacterium]|nr:GAF domain-containing protein [Methylomirabilota bacterium]
MDADTILIVDDDREVTATLGAYLTREGYAVTTAATGAEGLARLTEKPIALLLVDMHLPDMDGTRVMRTAQQLAVPPEVVVVTGHATIDSAIQAVEGGTAGYLLKPIELPRLGAVVRRVFERRRLVRENSHLQSEMAARLKETEALLAIAHTASATLDVQEALRRICRELALLVGAGTGAAYLLDAASGQLLPCAGYHVPKEMIETFLATPIPLGGQGFRDDVWEGRRPVFSDDVAADPRFGFELFRRFPHQSGLVLPLLLDDTVAGAFYFAWWTERKIFTERELTLVENVAAQVAVLIRHARLFDKAERERRQLGSLYEISRELAAAEDTDQILSLLVNEAATLLGVEAAGIRLVEGGALVVRALTDSAKPVLSRSRIRLSQSLSGAVVTTARPVVIADIAEDHRTDPVDREGAVRQGFHGYLGVPLHIQGRVIGCLNVYAKSRRQFTTEDVSLLSVLGDHASLAIHKARLYAESRAQQEEATKLYEVTAHLTATLDVDSVLDQIVAKTVDLLGCDASGVYVPDEARDGLAFRRGLHLDQTLTRDLVLKVGEGVAGRAFQQRRPVSTSDRLADPSLRYGTTSAELIERAPRAYLAVPIGVRDEVLGVLVAYFFEPHEFSEKEIQLLSSLAAHTAIAMDNARHYEEVRLQQSRLAQIFDSTSDGMLLVAPDGRVETANRRAGDLLAAKAADLIGIELTELLAWHRAEGPDYQRMFAALRSFVDDPERGGEGDLELRALRRILHWVSQPTRDSAGTPCGFTLTFHDVTHEREVSQMKSDFVSFVTHQLRTPLAGIKWMLELAAQEPDIPAEAASYVQDAREAAQRLIQLVNDLLDISRLERGKLTVAAKPIDLGALTREVLAETAGLVQEKGHRVTLTGDAAAPAVMADGQLLRQVVVNLVSNAIKYTPEGGAIEIGLERDGGALRWSIRDSGIGIPLAAQPRLFEKFYRAENVVTLETEGTGLGLYLVRLIMEQLEGRVWCESEEGAGAIFLFTLPLATTSG